MEIYVYAVEAHVAGTSLAHDGVQVGAIVVAKAACFMYDLCDLQNILIEESYSIGVGQHETCGVFTYSISQGVQINAAVLSGWDAYDLIAAIAADAGLVP